MLMLSREQFEQAEEQIKGVARDIDKAIFDHHFHGLESEGVIECLSQYQNRDGGFGNALEPDFRLPSSSAMATSIALRILYSLPDREATESMALSAIDYLECTFDMAREGWLAVPPYVNLHPHAPWWHYDNNKEMTAIDEHWGNPSAELIGYIYGYRDLVDTLDVDALVNVALEKFRGRQEYSSPHELYCYIRLYEALPERISTLFENDITKAVEQLVCLDADKWDRYNPRPLDFVPTSNSNRFGLGDDAIDRNLDYIIDMLRKDGIIKPHWGNEIYSGQMASAYDEWLGQLSVRSLVVLGSFSRIEK
ncbi:MAG TPA: hypothetical protein PK718_02175 [Candidatus Methanofastidiosa archaeon]|nr:hypothetical protein [Candidatus Methanofastidiosa archaeon]